jgi:hypothetical protein
MRVRSVLPKVTVAIILLILSGMAVVAQTPRELSKAEARKKFEEYIVGSFYLSLIEAKPDEVARGNRFFSDGWSAFFRYKNACRNCSRVNGRLVYMDAYGENIREEHQDVYRVGKRRKAKGRRPH